MQFQWIIPLPKMCRGCSRSANSWETLACIQSLKLNPSGFSTVVYNQHYNTFLLSFAKCDDPLMRLSRDQCSHRDLTSRVVLRNIEIHSFNEVYHQSIKILRWWLYARWQCNVPPQASHRKTQRYIARMSCDCLYGHENRKNWNSSILYSAGSLKRTLD